MHLQIFNLKSRTPLLLLSNHCIFYRNPSTPNHGVVWAIIALGSKTSSVSFATSHVGNVQGGSIQHNVTDTDNIAVATDSNHDKDIKNDDLAV